MLPHLQDRAVAVKRYPGGVAHEAFWEKDLPLYAPAWISHTLVPRKAGGRPPIKYAVVSGPEVLAWMAAHDLVEIHPFLHRADHLDEPDFVAIDLDPGERAGTDAAI